jgi:uncharacterized protein YdaU (DUF1376 family)
MSKDPAFLFYSKDWISGTSEMLPEEKGIYIDLLCYQHQNGNLPIDTKRLAKIVGIAHDDFIKIWETVSLKFIKEGERLINLKLQSVMTDRAEKGHTNKISGTFASVLRKADLSKKEYNFVRNQFKIEDFKQIDSERLTERLTEWLHECLKSIANADVNEDIVIDTIDYKEKFEIFRKLFGGTKKGLDTEYENFIKKTKNWKDVLPLLQPAVKKEIEWRKQKREFTPQWKNLSTWINNRCWEQEFEPTPPPKKELKEIPASEIFSFVKIDYGNYPHNED